MLKGKEKKREERGGRKKNSLMINFDHIEQNN
jgi:hypothetical protein